MKKHDIIINTVVTPVAVAVGMIYLFLAVKDLVVYGGLHITAHGESTSGPLMPLFVIMICLWVIYVGYSRFHETFYGKDKNDG